MSTVPPITTFEDVSDSAIAIDGFTWGEIARMMLQDEVTARCASCKAEYEISPGDSGDHCRECGGRSTVTSPLVKLGLI
jgi:tRNA(Ile2) C34 agmatinyltransferase TiaS